MSKALQISIENSDKLRDTNNWHPYYKIVESEISCNNNFIVLINCLEGDNNKKNCIHEYTKMMKCLFEKGLKLSDMYN